MGKLKEFLKRKDVVFSAHRYGIDAMGAMAQGLFASLLIGTIIKTLGEQIGLQFLVDAGTFAQSVAGPAMAASIGYALHTPPLVLFSLIAVGSAANSLGGAGGPLAVYFIAIVSAECGKLVSKETKVDIIVTPAVTILVGTGLSVLFAPAIGAAASAVGSVIMWATELQPLLMGILVSVLVGIALTLPISSAAICAALNLTGLAGGAAVAAAHHGCRGCVCSTTCPAGTAGMTTITGRRAAVVASAVEAAVAAVVSEDLAAEDAGAASAVDSVEAAVAAEEDSPAVAAAEDKHLKYLEIQKCQ